MNIDATFIYHKPFGSQPERYVALRSKAYELATLIDMHCLDSREKSLAITNLQQTIMWANAAIAINEKE
jgi:hypothetical protein